MRDLDNIFEEIKTISVFFSIFGLITLLLSTISLVSTVESNLAKSQKAETYYNTWYEQLPANDPLKNADYIVSSLLKTGTTLNLIGGFSINTNEEILKYELSNADITNLDLLEKYLNKKFDESHPDYLLIDKATFETLNKISLEIGQSKYLNLYRNSEKLSFDYKSPITYKQIISDNDIINLDFVKAYVSDSDIAKIQNNKITAVSKGKTKLILIYKTELLEIDLIIK